MPVKHTVKYYKLGGYYHLYNSGVNRHKLFLDESDYRAFEYYLAVYLTPRKKLVRYSGLSPRLRQANLAEDVELLSYCLVPDGIDLLVQLHWLSGATDLMKRLANAYTRYFNHKYQRSGPVFEGNYKALEIDGCRQAVRVSRYIHRRPYGLNELHGTIDYRWSSLTDYKRNRFRPFISRNLLIDSKLGSAGYVDLIRRDDWIASELS